MKKVSRLVALPALALAFLWAPSASPAKPVVVSVGDSYSAGEGAKSYDAGTEAVLLGGNGCHRSAQAWPRLLGVTAATHLACSGAQTIDFFRPQKDEGPDRVAQIPRLKRLVASREVARVLVTIGGNDLGFSGIVKRCLLPRGLPPCLGKIEERELPRLRNVVFPGVVKALTATQATAGTASILLVGYPDAIPQERAEIESAACHLWLARVEQERIYRIETALDTTLAAAAEAAGVEYLSIREALGGHGICARKPWINPLFSRLDVFEVGHPNEWGQEAIAMAVERSSDLGGD